MLTNKSIDLLKLSMKYCIPKCGIYQYNEQPKAEVLRRILQYQLKLHIDNGSTEPVTNNAEVHY